jgi:hypothetical protein
LQVVGCRNSCETGPDPSAWLMRSWAQLSEEKYVTGT